MKIYWLAAPYIILIIFSGIKNFLLSFLPPESESGHLAIHQSIKWYKWYLRKLKNIAALALLSILGSYWLQDQLPLINHLLFAFLAGLLLLNGGIIFVLWLMCARRQVPAWLGNLAVAAAFPAGSSAVVLGALSWGGGFILGGAAALSAWSYRGEWKLLIPSFVLFTLGFVSLLGGLSSIKSEDKSKPPD